MSAFDIATAVAEVGPEHYEANADPAWFVRRGGNGGYVAAVMLRALMAAVGDDSRVPRSLTVHYPAAFEGRGEIHARIERAGRSLTTAAARMTQGGPDRPVALAVGAFAAAREPAVDFADIAMPDVPGPHGLEPLEPPSFAPPFAHNLVVRRAAGDPPFSGSAKAYAAAWIALKDDERPLDYPLLAMLTDAMVPVIFSAQTTPVMSPTIDLTVHFRAALPADDAGPFLCVFRTHLASGGYMEEDGEVWSRDGVLLAQSRQLALAVPAEGM